MILEGQTWSLALFSRLFDIWWRLNLGRVSRPIGAITIAKCLSCFLLSCRFTEFFPRTFQSTRTLRPISPEEATRWIKRLDMAVNFLGEGSLLVGWKIGTIRCVMPCFDKRSESLVPRMLSDVYTPSVQHVVIVYYNGLRSGIAPVSTPIACHCCVFFRSDRWIGRKIDSIHGSGYKHTHTRQTKHEMEHREDEMDIECAAIDLYTNNTESQLIQQTGTN